MRIQMLCNGLNYATRQLIDAAAGGSLSSKTPEDAEILIENMASNECHWSTRQKPPKAAGIYEINDNTALAAKVEALTKRFDQFVLGTSSNSGAVLSCETCGAGHATVQCPILIASDAPVETVDYVGGAPRGPGNPYGNTYNPGWRNHPNFSWGQQQQHRPPQPQGLPPQPLQQPEKKFTTEDVLARFMISTEAKFVNINNQFAEVNTVLRNVQASIQSLENQVGKLARANLERPPGSLPSNTENNPREHLKAVTLRSGKQVEARAEEGSSTKENGVAIQEDPKPSESEVEGRKEKQDEKTLQLPTPRVPEYKPVIPYPARLKQDKDEAQFKKFLNRKLEELETVALPRNCSAVIQRKLPKKLTDPGSFIIPCVIGEGMQEKALADSGASINVMPYKLFLKLGLEDMRPTRMTIQLADRSIKKPRGVVEDVLVRVDKLIIPVDFVILDVDDDVEVPLILGRPFLNTAGALIDVKGGRMTLRVGDEEVILTLPATMKHTMDHDDPLYFTDETDMIITDCVQEVLAINHLDEFLEGMDGDECKGNNPSPTQVKQVGYVGAFPWPNNKKKSTTRKIWCKRDKKQKLGMNCTLSPPWEIDRLFFEGKGMPIKRVLTKRPRHDAASRLLTDCCLSSFPLC
ncbi:uncharacterized protein LOC120265098 [Dioscorea cayenensis subsp. rotundata]|uniref:Uncharacterized protein LOC120265098 n=1 Tax=Dioscorea cayennensis subsp. rotundata TaxID=55577 RepID=A0AB40BPS2_DIOCR|nr:uncharacterized protein LOC120265098 [Dioscorea cayenensis subsp. rotundata]